MADPKIKYDIEASVSGSAEVNALAGHVEKLASTLEGDLKAKALATADALRELGRQDATLNEFVNLRNTVARTTTELTAAQRAYAALGFTISATNAPTREQAGQLQKLKDTARGLEAELGRDVVALERYRASLAASGVNTNAFVTEQVRLKNALAGATTEAGKVVGSNKQVADSYDGVGQSLNGLKNQVAALAGVNIGAGMIKDVLATADAFNNLQARVKISTGEGVAFTSSFKEVSEIALRTGSNLEQTGILFTKLVESGKSAGLSTEAAIVRASRLTETINQSVQLSGGSAEAAKAAITQLVQGLQSGVLRGDEFNSVMEQSPRLAKALADGLGKTTGELRIMAEAGALTADVVTKAISSQSATLQKEFATLPATVGRSVEKLQTQWSLYIGDLDKGSGITAKVAKGLDLLAGNLNGVISTVTAGVAAYAGYVAVNKLLGDGAQVAAVKVTTQAVASAEAAVATRAHGAAATAAATQVAGYGAASAAAGVKAAAGGAAAANGFAKGSSAIGNFMGKVGNIAVIGVAAYEVYKGFYSLFDGLYSRISGLTAAQERLAAADKRYSDTLKESAIAQENQNIIKQEAIEKTFGLTTASVALVAKFDDLVKKGDSAAEAIGKIGKDFDLNSVPGIQSAGSVLDKLLDAGKITALQFKEAWSDALKGVDLAEFETKARVAFGAGSRGALELQQALDAGVREAIKRTGLDFEVISGGMGKASKSAINDTNAIIAGLDKLKAQGVDTGQALAASLSKGINTADSAKALEVVRSQIEQVRAALGNKVADGLLDQAKTKALELKDALDKATPGIQGITEAMKQLGVTSDIEFKVIAEKSKAAFDVVKESGKGSARELSESFIKVATDAINANKGIAPEWVKTEAAVRGVTIAVDANGKAIVESASRGKQAIGEVTQAYDQQAAAASRAALAAVNAKYSRPGEDPAGATAADDERAKRLAGQGPVDMSFQFGLRDKLVNNKLTANDIPDLAFLVKAMKANEAIDRSASASNSFEGLRDMAYWAKIRQDMEAAISRLSPATLGENPINPTPTTNQNSNNAPQTGPTHTVNISIPGLGPIRTDAAGAANIQSMIASLQQGARNAGR